MCLITEQTEPIVLKEDLIVYKTLRIPLETRNFKSVTTGFIYDLNRLYETRIKESITPKYYDDEAWCKNIDSDELKEQFFCLNTHEAEVRLFQELGMKVYGSGFHSYKTLKRANESWSGDGIFECTIPAGSEIYEDKSNLIVSNKIIINKRIQ